MNNSTNWNVTTSSEVGKTMTTTPTSLPFTQVSTQPHITFSSVVTTEAPSGSDSAVIGVVVVVILVTLAVFGVLLYRYLCHNKGNYWTTGELAPGEDPEESSNQTAGEKREYFI
ncbi:Small cell adhesion glycoprotein [Oryzias melastigma]|uniref:Small cell adhesion glycoprotein n=1 Tax=Oryzias melastigma TaxID=30732 RepID=A0A834F4U6_ORYME|nr:Small cell adhesion glycoprotein [Oryzias melastigma]